jgi:predicted Rossmann fold nucleotide-binding protein DprA/Smf involved in DNA uptake
MHRFLVKLSCDSPQYPGGVRRFLQNRVPATITALGNLEILQAKLLALFCSVKCPGKLILETYDLAHRLREEGATVIGGFHSPMERECLDVLLRGTAPVILCPARGMGKIRLRPEFRKPLENGRLLLLSPFNDKQRRATQEAAMARNRFVAALADAVFVAYAAPNSKTENFCREVLGWGKPLLTFESSEDSALVALGAKPLRAATFTTAGIDALARVGHPS